MKRFSRILWAILAATTVPALCMAFLLAVLASYTSAFVSIFILIAVIALVHVLIFGIATFMLLEQAKLLGWWTCTLSGALIGGLPVSLWMAGTGALIKAAPDQTALAFLSFFTWGGTLGAMGGLSAWMAWYYLQPPPPVATET